MSPQLLIFGQNRYENDVWSIGCVILAMILGCKIDQNIWIHPYNLLEKVKIQENKRIKNNNSSSGIYVFDKLNFNINTRINDGNLYEKLVKFKK